MWLLVVLIVMALFYCCRDLPAPPRHREEDRSGPE